MGRPGLLVKEAHAKFFVRDLFIFNLNMKFYVRAQNCYIGNLASETRIKLFSSSALPLKRARRG